MEQTVARTETRDRVADASLSHFLGEKNTVSHLLGVNLCQEQNRSGCCDLLCLIPTPLLDIWVSRVGPPSAARMPGCSTELNWCLDTTFIAPWKFSRQIAKRYGGLSVGHLHLYKFHL